MNMSARKKVMKEIKELMFADLIAVKIDYFSSGMVLDLINYEINFLILLQKYLYMYSSVCIIYIY